MFNCCFQKHLPIPSAKINSDQQSQITTKMAGQHSKTIIDNYAYINIKSYKLKIIQSKFQQRIRKIVQIFLRIII